MEQDDSGGHGGDGSDAGLAPWEIVTPLKKRDGEDNKELQETLAKKLEKVACIPCAKKKSAKFTVHCPGCLMYFAPKDIAANQRLDHQCKGIMDKIYYIAKSQKRMAWYTDIRSNDQKLYQAVTSYKSRCPEPEPGQRRARTSATQIMTYMEAVLVSTKVVKDVEGEFMYEREFYAFAETWAGGKLSEERPRSSGSGGRSRRQILVSCFLQLTMIGQRCPLSTCGCGPARSSTSRRPWRSRSRSS